MRWEADDVNSSGRGKAKLIESYLYHKMKKSNFYNTVSDLLYDFITYGNCFGMVEHVRETYETKDGEINTRYLGPKLSRISPFDIVFNPIASEFKNSP
jgi:hypothetical protein